MRNLKSVLIILTLLLAISCSSDKELERKINALERRVAALETGATAANRATPTNSATDANIQLASNPEKINDDGPKPKFNFIDTEFDFGTINEGDIIEHTFNFTNTGESPLIIEKATASCGCTVPKWSKDPIPVGGAGEISVRFDSKNKPNQQIKTITISANTDPALTRLMIKGFVTPAQQTAGPIKQ